MAKSMISPTEEVRGTIPKKEGQPLQNINVSGGFLNPSQPLVGAGAMAGMPATPRGPNISYAPLSSPMMQSPSPVPKNQSFSSPAQTPTPPQQLTELQQSTPPQRPSAGVPGQRATPTTQQPTQDIGPLTDNTPTRDIGPLTENTPNQGAIGEAFSTNKSGAVKLADKAYKLISDAAANGRELDESTRKQIVDKLAEVGGTPEMAQDAMFFLGKRFDEKGTNEVTLSQEQIAKNQQVTDVLMNMDDETMLQAMKMSDIPSAVKQGIFGSEKYKAALAAKREKDRVQFFNDEVSDSRGGYVAPKTTAQGVRESLGITNPDAQTTQAIAAITGDDRLRTLSGEISTTDTEITGLQQELQNLKTNIEAEFPTSISKSALNAITYDRQIGINNKLQTVLATREAKVADYERVRQEKEQELQRSLQQQKQTMDFLAASDGAALFGMGFEELTQMEQNGQIPEGYSNMYQNYQEGLIYNTLAKYGNPDNGDMDFMNQALQQGHAPQDILANMLNQTKFQKSGFDSKMLMETVKSGDVTYQFNPETGRYDIPVGQGSIAGQTEAGYPEITDSTFSLFGQQANDYPGNTGADYPAPKGTAFVAPQDGVVTGLSKGKAGEIRVSMRFADGRTMTTDHMDETTIQHLLQGKEFSGREVLNIPVSAGETIGFVGNTGNVKTKDPNTGQYTWVRKDGVLLRPDLAHRGTHASVSIYGTDGKMYSVQQADQMLKQMSASHKDLSGYSPMFTKYIESGTMPTPATLKGMGMDSYKFVTEANKDFVKTAKSDFAMKGFDVTNAGTLTRTPNAIKQKLLASIDATASAQPSFDKLIALVEQYGSEVMPGQIKDQMTQLYEDILLQGKEIYNLGVLNGPDLEIMEEVLGGRPTNLSAKFKSKARLIQQFENARNTFNDAVAEKAGSYGLLYNPSLIAQRKAKENQANQQSTQNEFAAFDEEYNNQFNY